MGIHHRILQWLANEVVVKGLANNPAFQRFAVRSSQQAKELSRTAAEAAKSLSENAKLNQIRKVSKQNPVDFERLSYVLICFCALGHMIVYRVR